jgi:hypothetical protein
MQLVENPYVSDFTKKTLSQFGWREGDPIPAELSDLLLQIKAKLPASNRVDVLIDAAAMAEDDIANVSALLRSAKQAGAQQGKEADIETATANMSPAVADAYRKMLAAQEAAPASGDGPQIVDDLAEPKGLPVDESGPPGDVGEPGKPAVVVDDALPAGDTFTPMAPMPILPFCPRCGWDMKHKYDVDVTDNDKEEFLVTLLGGSRFRREYELAGGKIVVRLRSLLADENFLIQRQLLLDQNNREILSEAEWFLRLAEYRLACSLESIVDGNGKPIFINPELTSISFTPPADKPTQTALTVMRPEINTKALAHEVTRRIVHSYLRRFQRLVEALEAMVLEPSFWTGIEQPR